MKQAQTRFTHPCFTAKRWAAIALVVPLAACGSDESSTSPSPGVAETPTTESADLLPRGEEATAIVAAVQARLVRARKGAWENVIRGVAYSPASGTVTVETQLKADAAGRRSADAICETVIERGIADVEAAKVTGVPDVELIRCEGW